MFFTSTNVTAVFSDLIAAIFFLAAMARVFDLITGELHTLIYVLVQFEKKPT